MNINTITKPYDINLNINNGTIFYFLMLIVHRKLCIINKEDVKSRYLLLNYFKSAINTNENLIPYIINCIKNKCTLGEICDTIKNIYGEFK